MGFEPTDSFHCQRFSRPSRGDTKSNSKSTDRSGLQIAAEVRTTDLAHHLPTDTCKSDPRFQAVVDAWDRLPEAVRSGVAAWDRLPEAIRAGIVAMLEASPLADSDAQIAKRRARR